MCNSSVFEFFINSTQIGEFDAKRVLEIGSRYVNGSIRPIIEKFSSPKEYIGVDIEPGKFVDVFSQFESKFFANFICKTKSAISCRNNI